MDYKTLKDVISGYSDISTKGIYFLDKENEYDFIAYNEIYNTALKKLGKLQSLGLKPNDKLIFQLNKNKDFIFMFWACILGNIIPIPITVASNSEQRTKLLNVFEMTDESNIIISRKKLEQTLKDFEKYTDESTINSLKEKAVLLEDFSEEDEYGQISDVKENDIAFIQFSSGSTGMPKGVVITHKNLVTNIKDIIEGANLREEDSTLSWLPLTHDMGIIGFHLTPFYLSMNQTIIASNLFIHKPMAWLDAVSKLRATMLSSPNFGYKYFLSHYKENEHDWDLSCIKLIFNGAEPIDVDLTYEFIEKLKKHNIKDNIMYTVYGMAEASLGVTFPVPNSEIKYLSVNRKKLSIGSPIEIIDETMKDASKFVSNGYHLRNCSIKICDDDNLDLEQGYIGNIHIKGDNVTKGYYNNPEYTEKVISKDGWLSTGDLGFLYDDCLYITGRKKDLIILNGVNYYAHDIERVCSEIEGIDAAKVIACSATDKDSNEEVLIIFVNNRGSVKDFIDISKKVKLHLLSKIGIEAKYVIPVKKIYKTTSGKIKRYKYVEDYYNGEFDEIISMLKDLLKVQKEVKKNSSNSNLITSQLLKIAEQELEVEHIGLDDNLMEFGTNSIKILKIHSKINNIYKDSVSISDLYDYPTINKLAAHMIERQKVSIISNKFAKELLTDYAEESIIHISLNQDVINRLNYISKKENVQIKDIIFGLYAYLVGYMNESDNIVIQVIKDDVYAEEVEVNLATVEEISELYKEVEALLKESNKTYMLENSIFKDNKDNISVAFNCNNVEKCLKMLCYDIVLSLEVENKKIIFDFKNRFKEEVCVDFVEKFNNILAQI